MALYDRTKTRSFFSEIAHSQDICYYCEKAIRSKREKKEITLDEMNRELRELRGKIDGVRVPKFRYVGHEFTVCPECLKKICDEVLPKEEPASTETKEENANSDNVEQPIEQVEDNKSTTKGKSKAKNASKES